MLVESPGTSGESPVHNGSQQHFHGKVVDVTRDSMIIELTGKQEKLDAFINLLDGYEILEVASTGLTGLERGSECVVPLKGKSL